MTTTATTVVTLMGCKRSTAWISKSIPVTDKEDNDDDDYDK